MTVLNIKKIMMTIDMAKTAVETMKQIATSV